MNTVQSASNAWTEIYGEKKKNGREKRMNDDDDDQRKRTKKIAPTPHKLDVYIFNMKEQTNKIVEKYVEKTTTIHNDHETNAENKQKTYMSMDNIHTRSVS